MIIINTVEKDSGKKREEMTSIIAIRCKDRITKR